MIERLKEISLYLVIGSLVTGLSHALESRFLANYLSDNLITLLIALLAINTTTSSVVMTKLKEIVDAKGGDFSATINELRKSILEQVVFVVLAVLILVLADSEFILAFHKYAGALFEALLTAVFAAALHALYDTANSIFVILRFENNKNRSNAD